MPLPGIEPPLLDRPAHSLVPIQTILLRKESPGAFLAVVAKSLIKYHAMKTWGRGCVAPFLISALPGRFTPWDRATGTHLIGTVGTRAGLDAVEKNLLPLPRIDPIVSHYTN
jgi:hypothetical protein